MTKYKHTSAFILLLLAFALNVHAQNDTILHWNFAANCIAPPSGWTIENVNGNCTWRCVNGGITQENHVSTNVGCEGQANDWLITPPIPLRLFMNEVMNFNMTTMYVGGGVTVKYSTTYRPWLGNPNTHFTSTLPATLPGNSGNVDLSFINADTVYVAFHYTSLGNGNSQASRWTLLDILIKGKRAISVDRPAVLSKSTNSANVEAEVITDGGGTILDRGIIWSLNANPTLRTANTTRISRTGTTGLFDAQINGLTQGTRVYFRGYALNATDTGYTNNTSFFTLADEPAGHAINFTATTASPTSIGLAWTQDASAKGYIIFQKERSAPGATPDDAKRYAVGETVNDATVAAVINNNTTSTTTINNLLTGTRYFFSIMPFGINGTNDDQTINYNTQAIVPLANDSTFGAPTSLLSDIAGVSGSEATFISSVENTASITTATQGAAVWKLAFRDGGSSLNDPDLLPTIFKEFKIEQGAQNNLANWLSVIQSAALFDDSTGAKIGTVSVSATAISITGLTVTAADNNFKTATLRLSLKNTAQTDQSFFQFAMNNNSVVTNNLYTSSQVQGFANASDPVKNKINVSASKLRITAQPAATVEAGVAIATVGVELLDANNNLDTDTSLAVMVSATAANLLNAPVAIIPVAGKANAGNLIFNAAANIDTLVFTAGGLAPVKSTRFKVRNANKSDIALTSGFNYTSGISYEQYPDSASLTPLNSVAVFGITLRDGGNEADADFESTVLTGLKLSVSNHQVIKTLALFDSAGTNLREIVLANSTPDFTLLNVVAPDNGTHKLTLRATFKKQVTDNARIQFKITETRSLADTISSVFAAADAGGLSSSISRSENRIAVVGSRLKIVQQPTGALTNAVIYPAVLVTAIDTNNNTDMDGRIITLTASKGSLSNLAVKQVAVNPVTGVATFGNIIFNDTVTGTTLLISDNSGLTLETDTFSINTSLWYKSVRTGDWDSVSTWACSTDTGATWNLNPVVIPDASKHGRIIIANGHTITMRGSVPASTQLDETIIEAGATLVTPINGAAALTVNDGAGDDLVVYGKLLHTNSMVNSADIRNNARITVMPGGNIELAASGNAKYWAANPAISFLTGSAYVHSSPAFNSIGSATYFSADETIQPEFIINSNAAFSPLTPSAAQQVIVNGKLTVNSGKTLHIGGSGNNEFRNGFSGNGTLVFEQSSNNSITGKAVLAGNGIININEQATLQTGERSSVQVLDSRIIQGTGKTVTINGTFDVQDHVISGNAGIRIAEKGTLITSNINGINAGLTTTSSITYHPDATVIFNRTDEAQQVNTSNNAIIGTLVVANPYGINLHNRLTVNNELNLLSGKLSTPNQGIIKLNTAARITNSNIDHFINGKAEASVPGSRFLPLGKAGNYAPVTIYTEANDTAEYLAEYFDTLAAVQAAGLLKGSLKRLSTKESWYIKHISGNGPASISFSHRAVLNAGENNSDIRVVELTGSNWNSVGPAARNASATAVRSDATTPDGYFAIAIDSICVAPAKPIAVADTVCYGQAATLPATHAGDAMKWYASATSLNVLFSGNNFVTANLYRDTVFYAESSNRSCRSERTRVDVTVVPVPGTPLIQQSALTVCSGNTLTLEASGTAVKWYNKQESTDAIGEGNSWTTGAITTDTVFYAAGTVSGCVSTKVPVLINTTAKPQAPYVTPTEVCSNVAVKLGASANVQGIRWFATPLATQAFATAPFFTFAHPAKDTSFYAEAFDGNCISERSELKVKVTRTPLVPEINALGFACKGRPVTLSATSTDTVRWFISDRDSVPVFTGKQFETPSLNRNTVYFIDAKNGICSSPKLALPVTVLNTPEVYALRKAASVKQYDSALISMDASAADEFMWDFGADATPASAVGAGPFYVKWTKAGTQYIRVKAQNKSGVFSCDTWYTDSITVTPNTGLAERLLNEGFSLYPNPAKDLLHVSVPAKNGEQLRITLSDVTGKTIMTNMYNSTAAVFETTLNLSTIQSGIYLLHVNVNGVVATKKIVLNK